MWPISLNITHFHKSNPFDQIEPILLTVTHFSKCDPRLIKCAQIRLKCLTCHEDNTACSTKLSPVRRGYFLAGWRYSKSPCSSYFIFFVMFEVSFWICRHFFYITSAIFLAIAGPRVMSTLKNANDFTTNAEFFDGKFLPTSSLHNVLWSTLCFRWISVNVAGFVKE